MPETVSSPRASGSSTRAPSQRILNHQKRQTPESIYPGLNDMGDALEALPLEIIKHFTLLREIDAKCVSTAPKITQLIIEFLKLPLTVSDSGDEKAHPHGGQPADLEALARDNQALAEIREALLSQIRVYIRELMPCLEEKMHVAGIAAESIQRHISRIDYDFDLITDGGEIPDLVRIGPLNHPAIIADTKLPDNKSVHSQRSESRREAIKAKKAAAAAAANAPGSTPSGGPTTNGGGDVNSAVGSSRGSGGRLGTPSGGKNSNGKSATNTPNPPGNINNNANSGSNNSTINNNDKRTGSSSSKSTAVNGSGSNAANSAGTSSTNGSSVTKRRKVTDSSHNESGSATNNNTSTISTSTSARPRKGANNTGTVVSNFNGDNGTGGGDSHNTSTPTAGSKLSTTLTTLAQVGLGPNHNSSGYTATDSTKAVVITTSATYDDDVDTEPVYCYCEQVSFGEMVGCDGPNCKREWFHLPCIGLAAPPKGQWFCEECASSKPNKKGK